GSVWSRLLLDRRCSAQRCWRARYRLARGGSGLRVSHAHRARPDQSRPDRAHRQLGAQRLISDDLGSSASRSPSEIRNTHSTVTKIINPGGYTSHGAVRNASCDRLSMLPQLDSGTGTPKPRKLRLDSARMALAMSTPATTSMTDPTLGATWRSMTRACDAPNTRAAST